MTVSSAIAWFDPSPPYYGKIIITRANTYETYSDTNVLQEDVSLVGTDFFDLGDTAPQITENYGGDPVNTFNVAYPVTFYFWFQTNSITAGYGWSEARFQYHTGTNTEDAIDWVTIATITNFPPSFMNNQTVHFGFLKWTPPNTTNSDYLVRVWGRLENGMQNGNLLATNIDKDGDGNTWQDCEVLLVKSIPYRKPGTRQLTEIVESAYWHVAKGEDLPVEPGYIKRSLWKNLLDVIVFWK